MLTLAELVDHHENILPPLSGGQVHAFSANTSEPLAKLISVLHQQSSVLYICDTNITERKRLFPASHDISQAEMKFRRNFKAGDFYAGLERLSANHQAIVFHFSAERSPLSDFLLNGKQLVTLENWAARHNKVVCFCFSGDVAATSLQQWLRQTESRFQSLSSFTATQQGYWFEVHYWFYQGKVRQDKFRIRVDSQQQWTLDSSGFLDEQQAKLRLERAPIFYLSSAVTGQEIAPAEWQQLHSETAITAALERNSDDALLLSYYRGQDVTELMRTIFTLRSHFGRYLRIYIRELDQAIRHTDEQLLLQAGATLILPINLRFNQVISLIESSVGWRFARSLPASFAALQEQFVPDELQGYQPLTKFVDHVRRLARLANAQNIDFSFILGRPARGLKVVDVVQRFQHRRGGDLISSVERQVPIFLFGCRAQDVKQTLEFLFGAPLANLFAKDERVHTLQSLEDKLDLLQTVNEQLDLTEMLGQADVVEEDTSDHTYRRVFPQSFSPLRTVTSPKES